MGSSGSSLPCQSYIWDMNNPNTPEMELVPPSPLVCLRYNPKSTDTLVGGCYNGLITFFDTRKPGGLTGIFSPESTSIIEKSHHDPVYDVFWVSSKTGSSILCCSGTSFNVLNIAVPGTPTAWPTNTVSSCSASQFMERLSSSK